MRTLGQQKFEPIALCLMMSLVGLAVGLGIVWPELMPYMVAGAAALVTLLFWAIKWDISLWAWLWVLSYGILNFPSMKIPIEGFFDLNPPRLIWLGAIFVFFLYGIFHSRKLHFNRGVIWVMLLLLGSVALSAQMTGWEATTEGVESAPYFRFFASMLFPYVIFFILYNSRISEVHIRRALVLLTIYGWYAIFIAYMQFLRIKGYEWAEMLIYPKEILSTDWGIHHDRGRGAFESSPAQAFLVITIFFVDLFLIRRLRGGYRVALIAQAILAVPAVYFTLLRSAYLAFVLCMVLWILGASHGRAKFLKLMGFVLGIILFVAINIETLSTADRKAGGVAQMSPIEAREVLMYQTWEIFKEKPMFGVGFGHFIDYKIAAAKDPADPATRYVAELVQHNLFLNMLSETGVIGLILIVWLFWLVFAHSRQLWKRIPPATPGVLSRDLVVLFWVVFAAYLIDATFRDPLWSPFANGLLWCFAGMIACLNRELDPQPLELPIVPDGADL